VKAEDKTVGIGAVAEGHDEVLERAAGVIGKLAEERLRLLFCELAHLGSEGRPYRDLSSLGEGEVGGLE